MAETKPCIRCQRPIDPYARLCVYCNWDQAVAPPLEIAPQPVESPYTPPPDYRARNLLGVIAFAALLVVAFVVGSLIHGSGPDDAKAAQNTSPTLPPGESMRATVTLVPVGGGATMQSESPVTTAPAQPPSAGNVEVNGERTDATALPSAEYSAAARRALAERAVRTNNGTVDPRTIVGSVEPPRPVRTTPNESLPSQPVQVAAAHTEPIPLYQPVPPMRADRPTSARLFLTVGTDGRVHDINVAQSIPGEMPRLIASVQNWRFKPATQNGEPVTSSFAVDINVHPR